MSCVTWKTFDWQKTLKAKKIKLPNTDSETYLIEVNAPLTLAKAADSIRYHLYLGQLDSLEIIDTITIDGITNWTSGENIQVEKIISHLGISEVGKNQLYATMEFFRKGRARKSNPWIIENDDR